MNPLPLTVTTTSPPAPSAGPAVTSNNNSASNTGNAESSDQGFSAMLAKKLRSESKNKTAADSSQETAALLMADSAQTAATPNALTVIDPALAALMASANASNAGGNAAGNAAGNVGSSTDLKPARDSAALLTDASTDASTKANAHLNAEASTLIEKSLAKTKTQDASKAEAGQELATQTTGETPSHAAETRGDKAGLAAALNASVNTSLNADIKVKGNADEIPANTKNPLPFDLTALTNNNANPVFSALSGTANSAASGVTPTTSATLTTPLQSQAWGNQLVQQVKQFVLEGIGVAEIRLNPQELGPIRVEIALDNKQAAIHFSAQHTDTRDALNQNFARLREVLADAGLNLQNASTGSFSDSQAFSFMQQQRERNASSNNPRSSNLTSATPDMMPSTVGATTQTTSTRRPSGVDLFA